LAAGQQKFYEAAMTSRAVTQQKIDYLFQTDPRYPRSLSLLGNRIPESIAVLGNVELLYENPLALFCSVKCPGSVILKTYDFVQKLRETAATIIGGFHSPVERECLNMLLNSRSKVVICPARGIESMRIPLEYRKPLDEARLLIVSPFTENQRQPDTAMAERRNQLVGALAAQVFVSYADPRSKTENLCRRFVEWNKPLFTFAGEDNSNLVMLGANVLDAEFSALILPGTS
jgi:predicted Rossmann fold nucleotide-binding protein DprA/Smf involved in DNA uptake